MHRRIALWLGVLAVLGGLLVIPGLAAGQRLIASQFESNGDLIDGWYWLRDQRFQQYAKWTFESIPPGTGDLAVEITALASDPKDGSPGGEARFRLVYGFPGSGEMTGLFEFQVVRLSGVSASQHLDGRTCRGEVILPRAAFPASTTLVFRIERDDPMDNHVAFAAGSLVLAVSSEKTGDPDLRIADADSFASTGDLIEGIVWCRKAGQVQEWMWAARDVGGTIDSGAVNLGLLVTTVPGGASGLSAVADVTVLDEAGMVAEVGTVHLVNTFRPVFIGNSAGVGWAATGAYKLKDPSLIERGFALRVALSGSVPPEAPAESANLNRQFGGDRSSATLAYVVDSPTAQDGNGVVQATVYDILRDPQSFVGQRVALETRFYGQTDGLCPCAPLTPSDWLIGSQQFYMYVNNGAVSDLAPWEVLSFERPIRVIGIVRTLLQSESIVCPYLKLESVELREE